MMSLSVGGDGLAFFVRLEEIRCSQIPLTDTALFLSASV